MKNPKIKKWIIEVEKNHNSGKSSTCIYSGTNTKGAVATHKLFERFQKFHCSRRAVP